MVEGEAGDSKPEVDCSVEVDGPADVDGLACLKNVEIVDCLAQGFTLFGAACATTPIWRRRTRHAGFGAFF